MNKNNKRKLRRKIGMSVIDMGGNAVLGYQQYYDLEGEGGGGIVARAYGTCCLLSPTSSSVLLFILFNSFFIC